MRRRALWLGMLIVVSAGCTSDLPARSTSFLDRVRGGPSGPDAVYIEYFLIERPAGTSAINQKVWENVNEQVLPSEKRALLMENGLHVGISGGMLSYEMEGMIANPKSATGGTQQRLYVNKPAILTVNGPVAHAEFPMRTSMDLTAEPTTAKFEQARFSIRITPMHAPDGRLILKCLPEVECPDKKSWLPTGAAGPGWFNGKSIESYDALGWEVTLSSKEFLFLGAYHERGDCLANQIFGGTKGQDKVQRLLIIRAGRLAPADAGASAKDEVAPLASQASVSATRGQRP